MPNIKRNAFAEFQKKRIPGAVFFDLDRISDQSSPFPHMLPSATRFSQDLGNLGIKKTDELCIYDIHGLFSAARVYWTFRVFGHQGALSILDGGLPGWQSENGPIATDEPKPRDPVDYGTVTLNQDMVVEFSEMMEIAKNDKRGENQQQQQVLDARPNPRFTGAAPEPRPGLSSGHIPNSISLPFKKVQSDNGSLLPPEQLTKVLRESGIDLERPIVVTCGTGVTACILSVALQTIGVESRVYDESWTGYADDSRAGKMQGMIIKSET